MNPWPLIFTAIALGAVFVLYRYGFMLTKGIVAALFVFRPGRDGDRTTLSSCTGWVRHMGRFAGGRTYVFALETALSQGEAEVRLLDGRKQTLLRLTPQSPEGRLTARPRTRYCLRWEFRHATGKCELKWREE